MSTLVLWQKNKLWLDKRHKQELVWSVRDRKWCRKEWPPPNDQRPMRPIRPIHSHLKVTVLVDWNLVAIIYLHFWLFPSLNGHQ